MHEHFSNLKSLVTRGMFQAIKSHREVFKNNPNIPVALAHLSLAGSYFSAAESLYCSRLDFYQDPDLPDIFLRFTVFCDELLKNVETDHSHQWTDIEFQKLRETFMSSAFAFEDERLFS